ncbi:protein fwdA [miscellaneous Crenarchaeota group-15 archaeon DG-45]|uniref:Protein fwdA n=1 Tax=miscellaneous Crenarchaeota group-15 archaeon DG-45 TaxID=1685127 RepID=A0A0M0BNY9_9ARCH|nr:MAG: protein fwdA [miscellaneous Crenarchaeota group-15 archaeon DG-45]
MRDLIVKGGYVYDPLNGVDGERMDIPISGGRVVEKLDEGGAKVIDASGMVVMPGGVDLHSHIAGSKINIGRLMRPEDHRKDVVSRTRLTRAGVGYSCPSTFIAGYRYAQMGYTSVMEAAMPPLGARHVHEELNDTPIFDKAAFTLFGNNYFTLKYVKAGDMEMLKAFIAWMLRATRGYAVKIVNPGGVENWKWGRNVGGLDDLVDNFEVSPRQIITSLARANEELGLPHTIHLHCNNLGVPGNYETTIETMDALGSIKPAGERRNTVHVVHCQFNALDGENWGNVRSGAAKIASYVNGHPHVTLDIGQAIFTDTTTMTGDGPWQFRLHNLTGNKWVNSDVEMEAGAGVVPYTFRENNPANAIQWAIGLELALLIHDPWRVYMTTDHPNGGPFTFYPQVIAWLMSRKARTETMLEAHKACMRRTTLAGIYREYDFGEIATATRAATAKVLGLERKGHLGPGADGDVAVYDIDSTGWRPSMYRDVERAFSRAAYTIKGGEVAVKDGEVVAAPPGRTIWVDAKVPEDAEAELMKDLEAEFRSYYTIGLANYPVQDAYLPHQERAAVDARRGW